MLENIIITGVKIAKNDLQIKYGIKSEDGVQPYATVFDIAQMNQQRYKKVLSALVKMRYYLLNCTGVLPSEIFERYLIKKYVTYADDRFQQRNTMPIYVSAGANIDSWGLSLQNCIVTEVATDDTYGFVKIKGEYHGFNKPAKIETPKLVTPSGELNNSICMYPYSGALWSDYESLAVLCRQLIRNDTERMAGQLNMFPSVERSVMNRLENALQATEMNEA